MPHNATDHVSQSLHARARTVSEATDPARPDPDGMHVAYRLVRHIEGAAATAEVIDGERELPAGPVLGRRFAAAHRRLNRDAHWIGT